MLRFLGNDFTFLLGPHCFAFGHWKNCVFQVAIHITQVAGAVLGESTECELPCSVRGRKAGRGGGTGGGLVVFPGCSWPVPSGHSH